MNAPFTPAQALPPAPSQQREGVRLCSAPALSELLATRADRWVRRGACLAVLSMALALLWVGFALFQPAPASAATPDNDLSTAVADAPSARSTR